MTANLIIFVITLDGNGTHRRPIQPGSWDDKGNWIETNISSETPDVQAQCNSAWTSDAISAWQLEHPYIAPDPVQIANQQRQTAFQADNNRQAMITALTSATPAQLQTYINNNVTDLPSARLMLYRLALVVATLAS